MQAISSAQYFFTAVGAVLLMGAGFAAQKTRSFLAEAIRTEGTVIALKAVHTKDSTTYRPVVRFIDLNGQTVEFTSSTGSDPPLYREGHKVEVLYRPGEPRKARIHGFFSLWGIPALLGGLGGAFLIRGSCRLVAAARKRRRDAFLRSHGIPVETEFLSVEQNTSVFINGSHPYQVLTQWLNPATSEVHLFKSDNLWLSPSSDFKDRKITVWIDGSHPSHYWVDLSFLDPLPK